MKYEIDERPPTAAKEVQCSEQLCAVVQPIAHIQGLQMETFTAWQDGERERVQGIFLMFSTNNGPFCVGAIVRRNNGELRLWPRDNATGPIHGSTAIPPDRLEESIKDLVTQFCSA